MCLHCIVLGVVGLLIMLPFIGPLAASWRAKLTKKHIDNCDDEECHHDHED